MFVVLGYAVLGVLPVTASAAIVAIAVIFVGVVMIVIGALALLV